LVSVSELEDELVDDKTRGLSVTTQRLEVSGEEVRRYISVQCTDATAHDLFDVIGAELLIAVAKAPKTPMQAVRTVLGRWKRFWSDLPRSVMSDDQIAGLFGELWFIDVWLSLATGAAKAVSVWRGPFGARHDFEGTTISVEAKTTTARSGRKHHINGIDQLEKPLNGNLLLFSMIINRENGATNSLPVLIDAIRVLLQNDPEAASVFDNALASAGYSDAFRSYYADRTYRVVSGALFKVGDSFPRITYEQLVGQALMPGVSALEYNIDLDGFRALSLADTPETAVEHLRHLAD
jgi:hypothetical protein